MYRKTSLTSPFFHRMTGSAKTAWSFPTPHWAMYSLLNESHLTKNWLGKAFRVGSYRQLFTGLDLTCFLSGPQPADEGATSRNPSAAEYCTTSSSRKRLLTIRAYQPMRGTNSESLCSSIWNEVGAGWGVGMDHFSQHFSLPGSTMSLINIALSGPCPAWKKRWGDVNFITLGG